jgi:phosphoribosylglycinamide formyltransferase-1
MSTNAPPPACVLISGSGRTLRNLIERIAAGRLDLDLRLVISSSGSAGGLQYAADARIPTRVVRGRDCPTDQAMCDSIFAACREAGVQLVVMGGFIKYVPIPSDFQHRVVNIHPALIPAFCGKGFYGLRVHHAALDYGVKVTGCTVHFADDQYDHGPIILQRTLTVHDDDTPETLAARVFAVECEAYPEALQLLAEGRIHVSGRRVQIGPPR